MVKWELWIPYHPYIENREPKLANRYDNMCSIITDRPNGKWNSRPDKRKKTTPPSSIAERPNSTADVRLSASATEKNWVQQGCTVPSVQPCPDSCHVETESSDGTGREGALARAGAPCTRSARLVARPARYKLLPSTHAHMLGPALSGCRPSSATTRRRCESPPPAATCRCPDPAVRTQPVMMLHIPCSRCWCKNQYSNTRVYPDSGRGAVRPAKGYARALYYLSPEVPVVGGTGKAREGGKLPGLC